MELPHSRKYCCIISFSFVLCLSLGLILIPHVAIAAEIEFSPTPSGTIVFNEYIRPVIADMNGDGRDDLVTTPLGAESAFMIYYSEVGFTFNAVTVPVATNYHTDEVFVADFNKDGRQDVLLAMRNFNGNLSLALAIQNADGSFETDTVIDSFHHTTHVADLTGNGRPDIIVGGLVSDYKVYVNTWNGFKKYHYFKIPYTYIKAMGRFTSALYDTALLDVTNINIIGIWDHFKSEGIITEDIASGPRVEVADLNGSGSSDLLQLENISPPQEDNFIKILMNDGTGNFSIQKILQPGSYLYGDDLIAFDANKDSYPELFYISLHAQEFVYIKKNEEGDLSGNDWLTTPLTETTIDKFLASGDFNGDGFEDLVVGDRFMYSNDTKLSIFENLSSQ